MKIATLTHTYPRFTDDINAPFVEKLMERIASLGNEVSVLTAFDPAWRRMPEDHNVDLDTYKYIWPDSLHILGYSRTIEGNVRFRKRVLALSPFLFAGAYRSFLRRVKRTKPDIIHAHWILPNGFIAGQVAKATGIPLLIQLHGSDVFTAEKNPLFRAMARSAGRNASYILSPSPDLTRRLGNIGVDTGKIGFIPNTVETDFADHVSDEHVVALKKKLNVPDGDTVILAMGRMVYVKGFDYLLDSFREIAACHKDVTLVLAGGGVLYEDMKRRAGELGISDRVRMPGAVMRDEVPVYFRMADIFTVPSIRHESGAVDGLPVVVPEAMAAGLPVVASDLSGIPTLIKENKTGKLVPERSSKALAEALDFFLKHPDERKRIGGRSRKVIERYTNYDTVAGFISQLYAQMAQNDFSPSKAAQFEIGFE